MDSLIATEELRSRLHELARRSRHLMDQIAHTHAPERVTEIEVELEAIRRAAIMYSRDLRQISGNAAESKATARGDS
jgi:hypothetical protein